MAGSITGMPTPDFCHYQRKGRRGKPPIDEITHVQKKNQ